MDSINRNQPEKNHEDLGGKDAIEKIRELAGKAKTCFFCTAVSTVGSHAARPMTVQEVDEEGNLWFLSSDDSHKDEEVDVEPVVRLYFQGSSRSDFLMIDGHAVRLQNKAKIQELWEPIFKTWFTEGVDDPRITVIKVTPTGGYYWDTKHGNFVAGVKMLFGAAVGKTLDDSIEGNLKV